MKVVCKCTSIPGHLEEQYVKLTKGKNYTALTDFNDTDFMVKMIDDAGEKCWYPEKNFISLDVYRELKLKELGI